MTRDAACLWQQAPQNSCGVLQNPVSDNRPRAALLCEYLTVQEAMTLVLSIAAPSPAIDAMTPTDANTQ